MTVSIATLGVDLRTDGLKKGEADLKRVESQGRRTADSLDDAGKRGSRGLSSIRDSASRASTAVAGLVAAFGFDRALRGIINITDEFTQLESRLRLVTTSSAELAKVQSELQAISVRARGSYTGLTDLYVRLAQAGGELGASQKELLQFTEGVSNALTLSGASAQSASGALTQLSQALGGGVVRAEEFNSILEGAPEIARAVARNLEGVGGSIGRLRQEVVAGNVTSEAFFRAFLDGSEQTAAAAQGMERTVGQAAQQFRNTLGIAISETDMSGLVGAIDSLSDSLSDPAMLDGLTTVASGIVAIAEASATAASWLGRLGVVFGETAGEFMLQREEMGFLEKAFKTLNPLALAYSVTQAKAGRDAKVAREEAEAGARGVIAYVDGLTKLEDQADLTGKAFFEWGKGAEQAGVATEVLNGQVQAQIEAMRRVNELIGQGVERGVAETRVKLELAGATASQITEYLALQGAISAAAKATETLSTAEADRIADLQASIAMQTRINELMRTGRTESEARFVAEFEAADALTQQLMIQQQVTEGLANAQEEAARAATATAEATKRAAEQAAEEYIRIQERIKQELIRNADDFVIKLGIELDESGLENLGRDFEQLDQIQEALKGVGAAGEEAFAQMAEGAKKFLAAAELKEIQKTFIGPKTIEQQQKETKALFSAYTGGAASALAGLQTMTTEGSAAYKVLGTASAAAAVASAASAPWPANLAMIPAMIALMSSLGFGVGGGGGDFSGALDTGGASGLRTSGTILGDPEAASESITNALDRATEIADADLTQSRLMVQSLQNIETALVGVTSEFARIAGERGVQSFALQGTAGASSVDVGGFAPSFEAAISNVFGNSGIIESERERFNALADRARIGIELGVAEIFDGMSQVVGEAATTFGADRDAAIAAFQAIDISGIEFRESDNVEQAIAEFVSGLGDSAVEQLSAMLGINVDALQRAGEGLFDTLTRVYAEVEVARSGLDRIDSGLGDLDPNRLIAISSALVTAAGGMTEFIDLTKGFVDAFRTESQQLDIAQREATQAIDQLGFALPGTREEFAALVDSVTVTDAASAQLKVSLLALHPALDDLYSLTEEIASDALDVRRAFGLATSAFDDTLAGLGLAVGDLPNTLGGMQEFIDGLTEADQAALRPFIGDLDSLITVADEASEALGNVTRDLSGLTRSLEDEIALLQAADPEMERLNQRFRDLTEQAGDDAGALALIETLRTLEVGNLDAARAADAAADAEQALADERQRQTAIANERAGLERQLLELQGNTAGIRELERNALFESNRALFDRINALRDSQAAEEQAAQSVQARSQNIQQANSALQSQLDSVLAGINRQIDALRQRQEQARDVRADIFGRSLDEAIGGLSATGDDAEFGRNLQRIGDINQEQFATQVDFARAQAEAANALDKIDEQAAEQITLLEQAIGNTSRSFGQLMQQNAQSTATIADAIRQSGEFVASTVANAVSSAAIAGASARSGGGGGGGGLVVSQYDDGPTFEESQNDLRNAKAANLIDAYVGMVGEEFRSSFERSIFSSLNNNLGQDPMANISMLGGQLVQYLGQPNADRAGASIQFDNSDLLGYANNNVAQNALDNILNIPGFANGGDHMGGYRWVGERGPELEVTGPSRIISNSQIMSGLRGDDTRDEIAKLREEQRQSNELIVALLRANEKNTANTENTLKRVSTGGTLRTTAEVSL